MVTHAVMAALGRWRQEILGACGTANLAKWEMLVFWGETLTQQTRWTATGEWPLHAPTTRRTGRPHAHMDTHAQVLGWLLPSDSSPALREFSSLEHSPELSPTHTPLREVALGLKRNDPAKDLSLGATASTHQLLPNSLPPC